MLTEEAQESLGREEGDVSGGFSGPNQHQLIGKISYNNEQEEFEEEEDSDESTLKKKRGKKKKRKAHDPDFILDTDDEDNKMDDFDYDIGGLKPKECEEAEKIMRAKCKENQKKRPKKQHGTVNMEAFSLIIAQPTYGGRPVRKRAQTDLSKMFLLPDKKEKRRKVSTSRILNQNDVSKNHGKDFSPDLQPGARVQKGMLSSPRPDLKTNAVEAERPLCVSKKNQGLFPVSTKRIYEDLELPEYDGRLPREDLYEDKDVPLLLDLRDFQHTPRVLPKFKAKTEASYFRELDLYEERKERERRAKQQGIKAETTQSPLHHLLPQPLIEDRMVHLRGEMESLILHFGGLCREALELMPDLNKKVVNDVDQMMRKNTTKNTTIL